MASDKSSPTLPPIGEMKFHSSLNFTGIQTIHKENVLTGIRTLNSPPQHNIDVPFKEIPVIRNREVGGF